METYDFYELIVSKKLLDLSLCDFFAETGFDPNVYFSSTFWFSLNRLNNEEWFKVTDDVIEKIGFKDKGISNHQTNLFECLKKHFVESVDYILVLDVMQGQSLPGVTYDFSLMYLIVKIHLYH